MGIAKMKYLNVSGPEAALQQTLFTIARCACFAPESGEAIHSAIRTGANQFEPLLTKAKGLLKDLGYSSLAGQYTGAADVYHTAEVAEYLEQFAAEVARRSQRKTAIESELEIQVKTEGLLSHMTDMDVSVDELFSVQTLKVRFGRLPKTSYARLAYYADKGFNFTSYFNFIIYDFDGEYYWGLYFAPKDSAKDIDDIFASLYFERIWVPEFVHGRPQEALEGVRRRELELRQELAGITTPAGIATEAELAKIQDITAWLAAMDQLYEMKKYALVFEHTFYISGFVPQDDYARFESALQPIEAVGIQEAEQREAVPARPPVKLKNNHWARPYQMFTEMYGLPAAGEVDPTFMVSIIYSVLYGLMFADLGQGLVLGLVGFFLMWRKKHLPIGLILTRAAVFSCLFGLLFGSVFGVEHLFGGLWRALGVSFLPFEVMAVENVSLILLGAVGIGVFVVALSIGTNIVIKLRRRQLGAALFTPNGVAGLVFYLALVLLVADGMMLHTGATGGWWYVPFLVVLPLVLMYFQQPLIQLVDTGKVHIESVFDLLVGGFFEMFVTLLEYLANTVSFLRVGGFVLAHAGMMSVVLTLANMAGAGPLYYVVMAFGNIFVICLEGLIVGIQALRLNYYEVFSRFYEADGEPFEPLVLVPDTTVL